MRTKRRSLFNPLVLILIVLVGLLTAVLIFFASNYFSLKNAEPADVTADTSVETKPITETGQDEQLKQLQELIVQNEKLIGEIKSIETERNSLMEKLSESEIGKADLERLCEELQDKINKKQTELDLIKQSIEDISKNLDINIKDQLKIYTDLANLLANPLPIERTVEVTDEEGNTTQELIQVNPQVALYYEDIDAGYTYSFNSDTVLDPASMIKAPFILSLLIAASEEEKAIAELREKADPDKPFEEPERVYDMTKKITYSKKEYYQSGTGEIVDSEDGTEYTYLELFYHVLECSDNVAYAVLRKEYGSVLFSKFVVNNKLSSLLQPGNTMSTYDAVKIMKLIYEFTESDAYYAAFMKDAMLTSKHSVMIASSVSPYECAHKYGWDTDSYCDMGIIYAERPYALAIMTNYDSGGREVNTYVQSIIKKINALHKNLLKINPPPEPETELETENPENA